MNSFQREKDMNNVENTLRTELFICILVTKILNVTNIPELCMTLHVPFWLAASVIFDLD